MTTGSLTLLRKRPNASTSAACSSSLFKPKLPLAARNRTAQLRSVSSTTPERKTLRTGSSSGAVLDLRSSPGSGVGIPSGASSRRRGRSRWRRAWRASVSAGSPSFRPRASTAPGTATGTQTTADRERQRRGGERVQRVGDQRRRAEQQQLSGGQPEGELVLEF